MTSFNRNLLCVILVTTACFGPGVKATPSPGEDSLAEEQCIPALSVSDNAVDNTILIRVAEGNTCPISDKVFLFIQDNRPQPLKLSGFKENFLSSTWVVHPEGVRSGQYRVMGINPTPNGIGDNDYIRSRDFGIDQVITIGGNQGQEQSAPALPPVVTLPVPRQQESRSEPSQAQGTGQKTLLDVAWCVYGKLGHIIWNGWKTDFSSLEVCFSR
jgi:hypothetical protein